MANDNVNCVSIQVEHNHIFHNGDNYLFEKKGIIANKFINLSKINKITRYLHKLIFDTVCVKGFFSSVAFEKTNHRFIDLRSIEFLIESSVLYIIYAKKTMFNYNPRNTSN